MPRIKMLLTIGHSTDMIKHVRTFREHKQDKNTVIKLITGQVT